MELRIREFRKEDMDALYFLGQRCLPPERRLPYHRMLDILLDRDVAALVAEQVAEGPSRLLGGLIVQGDPWNQRLFIVSLMVDGEWRRLGIARRLLAWAERLGEGFQCRTLLVPLEAGNADGAAFLAAQGFHESGQARPFFSTTEQGRLWTREVEGGPQGAAAGEREGKEERAPQEAGARNGGEGEGELETAPEEAAARNRGEEEGGPDGDGAEAAAPGRRPEEEGGQAGDGDEPSG